MLCVTRNSSDAAEVMASLVHGALPAMSGAHQRP